MTMSFADSPQTSASTTATSLPLVAAQPGIWVADQLATHGNDFIIAHCHRLHGEVREDKLIQSIQEGMEAADTLKMKFRESNGKGIQSVNEDNTPVIEWIDLRDSEEPDHKAQQLIHDDLNADLQLTDDKPLIRHLLLRISDVDWVWYQRYHHIQLDAFSLNELTKRIAKRYNALCKGKAIPFTPFTPFSQVVDEYQHYYQSAQREEDALYWNELYKKLPEVSSLSPKSLSHQSATGQLLRAKVKLSNTSFSALSSHFRASSLTPYDLALGLVSLWLLRLTNQPQMSAGFVFMRRLGSVALNASGPVINVLPMVLELAPDDTLTNFSHRLSNTLKSMRQHQKYDAEDILRESEMTWNTAPMYGPVINFKAFNQDILFDDIECVSEALATGPVRDLELQISITSDGNCHIEAIANAERYQQKELECHLARLSFIVDELASQPDSLCQKVNLLLPSESEQLAQINDTQTSLAPATLASILQHQANATPTSIALVDHYHRLDYASMQDQVARLAALIQKEGVKPGDIVAVALPRSVLLSIALQSIVCLGAAWLPLDVDYPDDRIQLMLEDACPSLLITNQAEMHRFGTLTNILQYEELLPTETPAPRLPALPAPDSLAYLIYTSGSTGRPKGVMVDHQAIVNRLLWMQHQFPLTEGDVVLQKTPCSFDVSVWEFFWPLMVGATLVMAPPGAHRDPEQLKQLFTQYGVTTLHFVPSMLSAFIQSFDDGQETSCLSTLRQVFASGEALTKQLAHHWEALSNVPLYNLYGPTEAAVDVSWYPAFGKDLERVEGSSVPIGIPVWNTQLWILDEQLQQVPFGVSGDLYISGIQLAQGYLRRPELTQERFIPHPFHPGERLYQSGDTARWIEDGVIEYLGRNDDQLKIRGQRIEPGEITSAIEQLPGVAQATTQALVLHQSATQPSDNHMDARQLVSYVVSHNGQGLDMEALKAQLCMQLPAHMVPVALVQLDSLPLTANGKLDRKALPHPHTHSLETGRALETSMEYAIAETFSELLGIEGISAEDDFFSLGGHSLLALQLAAKLRQKLDQDVTIGHIMKASKIALLANLLEDEKTSNRLYKAGHEQLLEFRQADGPTLYCIHPASGFAWQFSVLRRWISPHWSLVGVQSTENGPLSHAECLDDIVDAHLNAILLYQSHGPYYLLGYSLGGTLALALARKLTDLGHEVALVGLLDTWPPESHEWSEDILSQQQSPVIIELNREREAFIDSQRQLLGKEDDATIELFKTIEGNYASSVKLLNITHSNRYEGAVELFRATIEPHGDHDLAQVWRPWLKQMNTTDVACRHVDIISAKTLESLGPQINQLLAEYERYPQVDMPMHATQPE